MKALKSTDDGSIWVKDSTNGELILIREGTNHKFRMGNAHANGLVEQHCVPVEIEVTTKTPPPYMPGDRFKMTGVGEEGLLLVQRLDLDNPSYSFVYLHKGKLSNIAKNSPEELFNYYGKCGKRIDRYHISTESLEEKE